MKKDDTEVSVYLDDRDDLAVTLRVVEEGIDPSRYIVNIWRDPTTWEIHVSVHSPERILLSVDCDWWEAVPERDDPFHDMHPVDASIIMYPEGDDGAPILFEMHDEPCTAPQLRQHLNEVHHIATQDLDDTVLEDVHDEAHMNDTNKPLPHTDLED